MMMSLRDFIREHPWWTGLVIFTVGFVINTILRLRAAEARMSTEEKIELRLHRAAMALRKLGRAKRLLTRYLAVRVVAFSVPMPSMVQRLWRASSDAGDAVSHLTAVLKKISNMGAAPSVLAVLDRRIAEAHKVRESCRNQARSFSRPDHPDSVGNPTQIASSLREAGVLLKEVEIALTVWNDELMRANASLSRTTDPAILRSNGIFRNPFKPETSVEDAQTRSILALRESQEDLGRTQRCAATMQHALLVIEAGREMRPKDLVAIIGHMLDEIDTCLAEAGLPLPAVLASGESPADDIDNVPSGLLQRVYQLLVRAEVIAWAALSASP